MPLSNRNPRDRSAEFAHHLRFHESLESRLCRLHIRVLCFGKIPDKYFSVLKKYQREGQDEMRLKIHERDALEVILAYLEEYGLPQRKKNGKPMKWFTYFQMRILLAFCDFIDDPRRCHQGRLMGLHQCKSGQKTLQAKQRVTIVQTVTTMFCSMNIDGYRIGRYADKSKNELPIFDEYGNELLRGITHYELRGLHSQVWRQPISRTKYNDVVKMLKLAGFLEVESCYLAQPEAAVLREELREQGASEKEIEAIPSIKSQAAYKWFTRQFIELFGIHFQEKMKESLAYAKESMTNKKLSNIFAKYSPFSDGFWTKKRKEYLWRLNQLRYPQGCPPALNHYGDDVLPELGTHWH
ncbi:hypothetical protein VP758_005214 [Vibrio harveyi]|nr:hypothetical protein [Vibrio harveyi]